MSIKANLYLLQKEKWDHLSSIAMLVQSQKLRSDTAERKVEVKLTPPISTRAKAHKTKDIQSLLNLLSETADFKFRYKWSGNLFFDLLVCLKMLEKIDLMEEVLVQEDTREEWYVLNSSIKQKYAADLLSANFTESNLQDLHRRYIRFNQGDLLRKIAEERGLSTQKIEYFLENMTPFEEVPEAGKAFLDGINLLQQCFQRIDERSVVVINIG